MSEFDYIIVGGGSAGCVLANRLTENPNVSVCLLETGPPDKTPFIQIPAMFAFLQESEYAYQYDTCPSKRFNEVTVTEGAANAVDSLGGSHPIPQSYQEKRKGFQAKRKNVRRDLVLSMAWYISEVINGITIIGLLWEMKVGHIKMFCPILLSQNIMKHWMMNIMVKMVH